VVWERVEIKFPNFHSSRNPLRKGISSTEIISELPVKVTGKYQHVLKLETDEED